MRTLAIGVMLATACCARTTVFPVRDPPSGTLDPTFGEDGIALVPELVASAEAVALTPDGETLIAGGENEGGHERMVIARLDSTGELDVAFGTHRGFSRWGDAWRDDAFDVALTPDGQILVAGRLNLEATNSELVIARADLAGLSDATFGDDGIARFAIAGTDLSGHALVVFDGGYVASGYTFADGFIAVGFHHNGSVDTDFGIGGSILLDTRAWSFDQHADMALAPDGTLVLAGHDTSGSSLMATALARLTTGGDMVASFPAVGDRPGILVDDLATGHDAWSGVAVQPDGKIVAAGRVVDGTAQNAVVARYDAEGRRDASFGEEGLARLALPSAATDVALLPDGRVLVCGAVGEEGERDALVYLLNSDGTLDEAFASEGMLPVDINGRDDSASDLAVEDWRATVVGTSNSQMFAIRILL